MINRACLSWPGSFPCVPMTVVPPVRLFIAQSAPGAPLRPRVPRSAFRLGGAHFSDNARLKLRGLSCLPAQSGRVARASVPLFRPLVSLFTQSLAQPAPSGPFARETRPVGTQSSLTGWESGPVANAPEVREYMAIGVVKDEEVGQPSEIKEVVYAG